MTPQLMPVRSVDDVIVPPLDAPGTRSAAAEREAFLTLSDALARKPESAVQRLVEVAMRLTGSQAAGVSLEELDGPEPVFRWVAVAGEFERYLNGTMPRHFSPCGTVLSRSATLVMRDPIRFYPYLDKLHVHVHTVLLVPFATRGRLVGTLWVLQTQPGEPYCIEDARALESLTTFSSSLLDALSARRSRSEAS